MGFVTIVSGIASTGEAYGLKTLDAALVLYWISVGTSKTPRLSFARRQH